MCYTLSTLSGESISDVTAEISRFGFTILRSLMNVQIAQNDFA
jgi:hypothetical protein